MKRGHIITVFFILAAILVLAHWIIRDRPFDNLPAETVIRGKTMGTTYTVKIISKNISETRLIETKNRISGTLIAINKTMSVYDPGSEISRFNKHQSTRPFKASKELLDIFTLSHKISSLTGGAFDITTGPLIALWGFGPEKPGTQNIQELLARTGYKKMVIDQKKQTISKTIPGLSANLSAIAKGYGVDEISNVLQKLGYVNYMVEIGGEVAAKGKNRHSKTWTVGIERPRSLGLSIQEVLYLKNHAIATSGDYRNFRIKDGKKITHIIDPLTGYPVDHNLASVTVIHPRCTMADALATALMVLGSEKGLKLAEEQNLAVYFLIRQNSTFTEKMTTAFTPFLTPD